MAMEVSHASAAEPPTDAMHAGTIAYAREVFEDDARALRWLSQEHPVLKQSPLMAMRTRDGVVRVQEILLGIEHGIV